jgi:hypothetical protein
MYHERSVIAYFNYPTLGELYKYAVYDAMLEQLGRVLHDG